MWSQTARLLLKILYPQTVKGTLARDLPFSASSVPRRRGQFTSPSHSSSIGNFSSTRHARPEARNKKPNGEHVSASPRSTAAVRGRGGRLARELSPGEHMGPNVSSPFQDSHASAGSSSLPSFFSSTQRARYHAFQNHQRVTNEQNAFRDGTTASLLTPLPQKYGFYNGIDEHGLEPPRPTREMRQRLMQEALESQAASVVEFSEGGEEDVELNGLPESEFHGSSGWTTIPKDSALFNSVYTREELESRQRTNSWKAARLSKITAAGRGARAEETDEAQDSSEVPPEVLDGARRRRHHDEGSYSHELAGELLEPVLDSVGQPRSVYALRKMYVKGLTAYRGIVSRAEEAAICDELLQLLQHQKAAYIAEESRYCVNLYESGDLGLPGKDTLAFGFSRAPTLQRVLYRLFFLGLIPSVPNVCQVSEMIGTFSGYPIHHKPPSIGAYFGLLNLVSTTIVHLQHRDCPWYPRLYVDPRSLFIVTEPCLGEYGMGYKRTHEPFHTFEYATRVSKDYRIEVLFATIEVSHNKTLRDAICLTEYAQNRLEAPDSATSDCVKPTNSPLSATSTSIDPWLEKIRRQLHEGEVSWRGILSPQRMMPGGSDTGLPSRDLFASDRSDRDLGVKTMAMDGHALRREMAANLLVGGTPKTFTVRSDQLGSRGVQTQSQSLDMGSDSSSCCSDGGSGGGGVNTTSHARGTEPSTARRRLEALKTRYEFAKLLKSQTSVYKSNDGPTLIHGRSPHQDKSI